jgi:hypothetical protein
MPSQNSRSSGGVELPQSPLLLAGLQPRQVHQIGQQAAQRCHRALQDLRDESAARICLGLARQDRGGVGDDADGAAQVVRRLAPALGPLPVQAAAPAQRGFQLAHPAGRLGALQALVARRALGHPFAAQPYQRAPRDRHDLVRQLWILTAEVFQLGQQGIVQMAPFTDGIALVVALLPAVQAVFGRHFVSPRCAPAPCRPRRRLQPPVKRIQHLRYVVIELRARQACRGGQLRIARYREQPGLQDLFAPRGKVSRQRRQFGGKWIGFDHGGAILYSGRHGHR